MKNFVHSLSCFVFTLMFFVGFNYAQNSLTHNTGSLQLTVIENGYIGDNASGTYGGVVFNGNVNAMFTAGLLAGIPGTGASGMIGSFQSGGVPVIQDLTNIVPISGFTYDPFFDQISDYSVGVIFDPDRGGHISVHSNTGDDFVFLRNEVINNSTNPMVNSYFGIFADWDVGGVNYLLNRGGYDPVRNMLYQYENVGAVDPNYYGVLLINKDPNTVKGSVDKDIVFTTTEQLRSDIFDLMINTSFNTITVDGDYRTYISSGPYTIPPGATLILDYAFVAGTSLANLQENADDAIIYGVNIPVELTSFTASLSGDKVILNWYTATETNNLGFEVERSEDFISFNKIGFVPGFGTTTEPRSYSYTDQPINCGKFYYRLKQVDYDGSFEYSDVVEVNLNVPTEFSLQQNYPNPFNPSTKIKFSILKTSKVTIKIYDILGNEIETLVNEEKPTGTYEITWYAENLTSGVYFYQLRTGEFLETKKMILIK